MIENEVRLFLARLGCGVPEYAGCLYLCIFRSKEEADQTCACFRCCQRQFQVKAGFGFRLAYRADGRHEECTVGKDADVALQVTAFDVNRFLYRLVDGYRTEINHALHIDSRRRFGRCVSAVFKQVIPTRSYFDLVHKHLSRCVRSLPQIDSG